ncbi:MAG: hypothetical protein OXF85_02855 [Candidatus Saccharibacteria bacterium]|nr:hypothetical protein [Candidatus Saccharibacteria bacterium]
MDKKQRSATPNRYGKNVQITGNRCTRCGHEWKPRSKTISPKKCPKCTSPYWQQPIKKRGTSEAAKKKSKAINPSPLNEGK